MKCSLWGRKNAETFSKNAFAYFQDAFTNFKNAFTNSENVFTFVPWRGHVFFSSVFLLWEEALFYGTF